MNPACSKGPQGQREGLTWVWLLGGSAHTTAEGSSHSTGAFPEHQWRACRHQRLPGTQDTERGTGLQK